MDRFEVTMLGCLIAWIVSICAMVAAFVCVDMGVLGRDSLVFDIALSSPMLVFAGSLWAIEISQQSMRKRNEK